MDERDKRRVTLKRLVSKFETTAAFARRYTLDPTYISQLINGHRPIGEKAAKKLELAIGLPSGGLVSLCDDAGLSPPQPPAGQEAATLLTDEAMLLEIYRAAGKEAKNFALTALINGYTARPSSSVASPYDIFAGLLDMDVDAYFGQPEQERQRIALEVGEKVVNILDPRKRTRDPAEVGRTYQRKDDPPELRAKQGK